jgi:rhomboid protease GluP
MGFVRFIMVGTIGLYVATLMMSRDVLGGGNVMQLLAPDVYALVVFGASGSIPVFDYGRWWTVLSAGWLHGGLLHIFFNMLWVRQLAPEMAELFGPGRTVIVYTVAGIVGFTLSSIMGLLLPGVPFIGGGEVTVGASAPIFGLLGALIYYGRNMASTHVSTTAWQYAVILFLLGLFGIRVDNWAHAGGFVGGYAAARWLNPSARERVDHLIGALICLVLSSAAVAWSLVDAFLLRQ